MTEPIPNRIREPASSALAPETRGTQSNSKSGPLGLFGGRFDPVHRAHLHIAQAVADQLGLSEIRWIVTGDPVHKSAVASAQDRLAMVRLALNELGDPRMQVDEREIITAAKTGKPSFSADTVAAFQEEQPGCKLVWILGEDQLQDFQTWSRWEWLIINVELAVCARPKVQGYGSEQKIKKLGGIIHRIKVAEDSVSSTQIRSEIQAGNLTEGVLPQAVEKYIRDKKLYLS